MNNLYQPIWIAAILGCKERYQDELTHRFVVTIVFHNQTVNLTFLRSSDLVNFSMLIQFVLLCFLCFVGPCCIILHHFAPLSDALLSEKLLWPWRRRHDSATGEDLQPESPSSFGGLTRCISHAQETGYPVARQAYSLIKLMIFTLKLLNGDLASKSMGISLMNAGWCFFYLYDQNCFEG